MVDDANNAVGWIGAIWDKDGWEIHPIADVPKAQRQGIGFVLVEEICKLARESGAAAVRAGTSDETNATSFSSVNLYENPYAAMQNFKAPEDHAVNFWIKAGFTLVGVLPDAEGLGKPGIHFSKRVV